MGGGFLFSALPVAMFLFGAVVVHFIREKHLWIWLPAYVRGQVFSGGPTDSREGTIEVFFCMADHFEPGFERPGLEQEQRRVDDWMARYPELAARHRDADGRPLQYTFFYPEEEYRAEHLDKLTRLCKAGFGDVEIHLHHDRDTAEGLREKLIRFKNTLFEKHGLLRKDPLTGEIVYGFIHGNWALDNSLPDGRWCGVNNELQVLRETGCYADFTLPSAPSETQTRKINSIYYATDDPRLPKSHDDGIDVAVGKEKAGDLMIIQGPLTLNWRSRKWGVFPRIENGEISADNPPTSDRVDLWVRQGISVAGRPNWVFIKVYTHGAQEKNRKILLGEHMDRILTYLEKAYNDGMKYRLHYVTAFELYRVVQAAIAGGEEIPKLNVQGKQTSAADDWMICPK